jgi:predicted MFS family arabinose efflux permease
LHFAINSAPLYLRFAKADQLQWLMPMFWVGFNLSMFPAAVITNRLGGYRVMGGAALIGALSILAAHLAQGLELLVIAQFAAGAAWGAILMSAFTVAFAIGENGGEGRMSGLLFSALALATLARMATVATGFNTDAALKSVLQVLPMICWAVAGVTLLYLAASRASLWLARQGT